MRRPRTPALQPSLGPPRVLSARARRGRPVRVRILPFEAAEEAAEGRDAPRRVARRGVGQFAEGARCGRQSARNVFLVELLKFLERVVLD